MTQAPLGCALGAAAKEKKHDAEAESVSAVKADPRLVGRVQSRPGRSNFVLVEIYGSGQMDAGTQLFSVNAEGKTAKLVVSGEKMSIFLVVDVIEGVVADGDAVYQEHVASALSTQQPVSDGASSAGSVKTSEQLVSPPLSEGRKPANSN